MSQRQTHFDGPALRVLETADRLFYENGYAATGINQIVAEAAVAKSSLYQHFPSKTDIALAYLDRRRDLWFSELRQQVNRHRKPELRLLALFDFLMRWLPETGYRGCAFINLAAEFPDGTSAVREHVRETKSVVRGYISELASAADAESRSDAIFLLFEGSTVEAQLYNDTWPIAVARSAAETLLKSVDE